ncbi:MAG: glycosyltransferase [Gammaproteobacteria bacterium]|nr:glycosyltransferase [Gammaproteobacteria bacterium]
MSAGIQFSIIVPVYNVCAIEHKFRRCVESILAQTFSGWELVLINDASTDATENIIRSLAAVNDRIRILANMKNMGQGMSRNVGTDAAAGDYIFYCDQDDYIYPHVLESAATFIGSHDRPEVIQFNYVEVHESVIDEYLSTPARNNFWWKRPFIVRSGVEVLSRFLHGKISMMCWSRAIRADFALRLRFQDAMPEDYPYILELCAFEPTVIDVRSVGYVHDQRDFLENDRQSFIDGINIWYDVINPLLLAHQVMQKSPSGHRVHSFRWVQHCAWMLDNFNHSDKEILAWGRLVDSVNFNPVGGAIHCLWRDFRRARFLSSIKNIARVWRYYQAYQRLKNVDLIKM